MKKIVLALIIGTSLQLACSSEQGCGDSKEAFLEGYYGLIEEATDAALPISDPNWKKYDSRFRAYVEECYDQHEANLTPKERRVFWSKSLKYYAQRYGRSRIKKLGSSKDKATEKVKTEVEKIWTDAEEAFEEVEKKVKPEKLLKPRQPNTQ